MGRLPKPSAIRALEGNTGHRKDDGRQELALPPGAPEPPEYLSAGARKEWFRVLGYLAQVKGLMSPADAAAVGVYCSYFDQWQQAEAEIPKLRARLAEYEDRLLRGRLKPAKRDLIESALGRARNDLNLASGERNKARKEMRSYLAELGMTPAARARIRVPTGQMDLPGVPTASDDPLARVTSMMSG